MMAGMRNPRFHFAPLAVGAPSTAARDPLEPVADDPFLRSFERETLAPACRIWPRSADVLLGNLEDAIAADRKEAARAGLVEVGRTADLGDTPLWTRVNSLESPWVLDDLVTLVTEIGDVLDVVMVPKVEGPWDIHYVDRLLAQLEARAGLSLRSSSTRSWRRRRASPTSRRSRTRRRACRAFRWVRPTSPRRGG